MQPARATLGAITTTIASVVPVSLVGGLAVQVSAELHFDPAGLGLIVACYFGGSALASIPAGRLVERLGAARCSRLAIALAASAMLAVAAFAHSYSVLLALMILGSGANSLGQLASNTLLAQRIPAGRQGVSFGIKQAAIPVTTLLAGATVPTIALTVGWRWAWVFGAVVAVSALLFVPEDLPAARKRSETRAQGATAALVVIAAAATLAAGAANALGTFLVSASVARGLDPAVAGLTLTLGSVVCIAARLLGGWLADRRAGGHIAVLAGMLAVGGVGLAVLALPGTPALLVGVTLGFGLGWSWPGLLNFAVVQLHPTGPAAATAITQSGVYLGGFIGPLALGTVASHTSYPTAWLCAGCAMLLATGGMLLGARMLRRQPGLVPAA